jgi:hypothetical protein
MLASRHFRTPDRRRFERYARRNAIDYEKPGPGDHKVYRVGGVRVQINFVRGDLDLASLKALARVMKTSPFSLARDMCQA